MERSPQTPNLEEGERRPCARHEVMRKRYSKRYLKRARHQGTFRSTQRNSWMLLTHPSDGVALYRRTRTPRGWVKRNPTLWTRAPDEDVFCSLRSTSYRVYKLYKDADPFADSLLREADRNLERRTWQLSAVLVAQCKDLEGCHFSAELSVVNGFAKG